MKNYKNLLVFILIIALVALLFAGCNKSWGLGNYSFKKVHVDTYHWSGCLTVKQWHDDASGIEVKTEEAGPIFLSEGTYILLDGDKPCPFCGE